MLLRLTVNESVACVIRAYMGATHKCKQDVQRPLLRQSVRKCGRVMAYNQGRSQGPEENFAPV